LKLWQRIFVCLQTTGVIFKWLCAVLLTGIVGGTLRALINRGIIRIGGNEIVAEISGAVIFGVLFGMMIFRLLDAPKKGEK
jgi:hypothetical protein